MAHPPTARAAAWYSAAGCRLCRVKSKWTVNHGRARHHSLSSWNWEDLMNWGPCHCTISHVLLQMCSMYYRFDSQHVDTFKFRTNKSNVNHWIQFGDYEEELNFTWNMSQSGCINSARKSVLYATDAMCIVWEAGSLGQKSSDARTTAVCFELPQMPEFIMPRIAWASSNITSSNLI